MRLNTVSNVYKGKSYLIAVAAMTISMSDILLPVRMYRLLSLPANTHVC